MSKRSDLELIEYETRRIPAGNLNPGDAERIWSQYGKQVSVDPPSFKNDDHWELTSQGWVGYLPVSSDLGLHLVPKVPLQNLLRMFDYAYQLKSFEFLSDVTDSESLEEFYQELANILAKRILDRGRKGYYRTYVKETDDLPFLRGNMLVRERIRRPWVVRLPCEYEEHTADIEENQILTWTLERIARSGLCSDRILPNVRRAYRTLRGATTVRPYGPEHCVGRLYNRLNEDYHPLHALCRFFLEHSGPTHEAGRKETLPFVVNMALLFERFVAEWLRAHLPERYELKYQERVHVSPDGDVYFDIDQVLVDRNEGTVLTVLDTKYKKDPRPSSSDISQIISYAEVKGCDQGILIYPAHLSNPFDQRPNRIRVRTIPFVLDGDLEESGSRFLVDVLRTLQLHGEVNNQ